MDVITKALQTDFDVAGSSAEKIPDDFERARAFGWIAEIKWRNGVSFAEEIVQIQKICTSVVDCGISNYLVRRALFLQSLCEQDWRYL